MKKTLFIITQVILSVMLVVSFISCDKEEGKEEVTEVKSDICTIDAIYINDSLIENFVATKLNYDIMLPYGTSNVPELTVEASDAKATVTVTEATQIPGVTVITVIAENMLTTATYMVNFSLEEGSAICSIDAINVDDVLIENFDASVFNYTVILPYGSTEVPVITAEATDKNAMVTITQAAQLPGATVVNVVSENKEATANYLVNFIVEEPNRDATLKTIQVNGVALEGFSSEHNDYAVELPAGTTELPTVAAEVNHETAALTITQVEELPGTATILVTAQDNSTKTYTINFTVEVIGFDNAFELLTAHVAWICVAYEEKVSGETGEAPEGSMYFAYMFTADGNYVYLPDAENTYEGTWDLNDKKSKIILDQNTEYEYIMDILDLDNKSMVCDNPTMVTDDGTEVDYTMSYIPYNGKSVNLGDKEFLQSILKSLHK